MRDEQTLSETIEEQAFEIGRQLRESGLTGKTVKIKIRWSDFKTVTRQTTLPSATNDGIVIFKVAQKLLSAARKPNQTVRLIGVGVSGIGPPSRQLELWDIANEG